MTQLTLSAAARAAGVSRSTLHDHINTGKVSVQIDGRGRRTVDTSELLRAYGPLQGTPDGSAGQSAGQIRTGADTSAGQELSGRVAVLEAENRGLQALLNEKDARIEELRHVVRLLEHTPAMPVPDRKHPLAPKTMPEPDGKPKTTRHAMPEPATSWDRVPAIIAGAVLLLVGLALVLQSLHVIRLS